MYFISSNTIYWAGHRGVRTKAREAARKYYYISFTRLPETNKNKTNEAHEASSTGQTDPLDNLSSDRGSIEGGQPGQLLLTEKPTTLGLRHAAWAGF